MSEAEGTACAHCGAVYAPSLLACPACGSLKHSERLKELMAESEAALALGDFSGATAPLRLALELLPEGSRQSAAVLMRIRDYSPKIATQSFVPKPAEPGAWKKWLQPRQWGSAMAGLGALLLKFKVLIAGALGKGKLLLAVLQGGLPAISLFGSFGVYWAAYGWKLAALLITAIYIHELGHLYTLRRYGFRASAPMFVPGLGAFVRLTQRLVTAEEEARLGLAGPAWGLGATVLLALAWQLSGSAVIGATAKLSAWINIFNLLPVPPLDGGRALESLDDGERLILAAAAGLLAFLLNSVLLAGIAIVSLLRASSGNSPLEGDRRGLVSFALVLAALAGLAKYCADAGAVN